MIRITRESDYGILLLSELARGASGVVRRAKDLAGQAALPYPMASKILKALARAGLLDSHRGANGGYSLAQAPETISIADVIKALEGPIGMTECTTSPGTCDQEPSCPVRSRWHEISGAVQQFLERIPLTDLLCPTALPPLQIAEASVADARRR